MPAQNAWSGPGLCNFEYGTVEPHGLRTRRVESLAISKFSCHIHNSDRHFVFLDGKMAFQEGMECRLHLVGLVEMVDRDCSGSLKDWEVEEAGATYPSS